MARIESVRLTDPGKTMEMESVEVSLPNSGRHYTHVKEALQDLPEMKESIERRTGWKLDLEKVKFEVVPAEKLMGMVKQDTLARMGTSEEALKTLSPDKTTLQKVQSMIEQYCLTSGIGAVYLPSMGTVAISENTTLRWPKDAFKQVLHHELTHVAQDQNNPGFFEEHARLGLRKAELKLEKGEKDPEYIKVANAVQARGALMEGQAKYHENQYKEGLENPDMKIGVKHVALGLLVMAAAPGNMAKLSQYIVGERIVGALANLDPRIVPDLFKKPQLADALFSPDAKVSGAAMQAIKESLKAPKA